MAFRDFASRTFIICIVGLLAACSQKAEMLKLSATQFGTATESAFDAFETAKNLQFAAFPKSEDAKRTELRNNMDAFTRAVTPSNIEMLVDRDGATSSNDANAAWRSTLADLRKQYQEFIAIFDNIEGGSAFGASAVTESGPILEKLRTQLATITKNLTQNPPQYLKKQIGRAHV